jgi:hypothetical protein
MRQEKSQLISIIHLLSFSHERDSALWLWEPNGFYLIKSMYHFLCFGGVKTNLSNSVWVLKIPLKDNLCKRGWVGDPSCVFCTNSKSMDHLFLPIYFRFLV